MQISNAIRKMTIEREVPYIILKLDPQSARDLYQMIGDAKNSGCTYNIINTELYDRLQNFLRDKVDIPTHNEKVVNAGDIE